MTYSWLAAFLIFSAGSIIAYLGLKIAALILLIIILILYIGVPNLRKELIMACILCIFGYANIGCRSLEPTNLPDPGELGLMGTIANYPQAANEKTSFILKTKENNDYLRYIQVYCGFDMDLQKGELIKIKGELTVPNRPGNPGEFDYQRYLMKKGVYYIMSVDKPENLKIIAPSQGAVKFFNAYRNQTALTAYSILPDEEAGIFLGMLLGITEDIEEEQYQLYQKTGIVHIFSVSGLHVGFLILFLSYLGNILRVSKKSLFYGTLIIMLVYGSLIGWPVPVQRTVIMASLALLARYQGREGGLGNSLGLAGLLVLFLDPYALFGISFQLSFMATWGLVFLYPTMKKYLALKHPVWDIVFIPLCAQLTVIPLIAYYFNLFTPSGLISNILISYLSGFIVILGFLSLLFVYLPDLAALFLLPAGLAIELLKEINAFIASIPGSFIWVKTPDVWLCLFYYSGIALMTWVLASAWARKYLLGSAVTIAIAMIVICIPASFYKQGLLQVVFLDVGQGDSILIKTPPGKFILIDGGGSSFTAIGEKKVVPYLRYRGIRQLYLLISSHPDQDHYQGLLETAQEISFKYLLLPESLAEVDEYDRIKQLANKYEAVVITPDNGHKFSIDGVTFQVFYAPNQKSIGSYNEQSLVLTCTMDRFSAIFPGDLEDRGLQEITDDGWVKKTLLLKVPHHGSRSSLNKDFYQQLKPGWAVISVGKSNRNGHPHQEVLDYLNAKDIKTMRTDQKGLICFETDGQQLKLYCFKSDSQ